MLKGFIKKIQDTARSLCSAYGDLVIKHRPDFKQQIIVMVDGGLASQMWQYALGYAASKMSGLPVKYDLTWHKLKDPSTGKLNYPYNLGKVFPGVQLATASDYEIRLYKKYFRFRADNICVYNKEVTEGQGARYLSGYYTNYRYFSQYAKELREIYQFDRALFESDEYYRHITSTAYPVALHVRRGDFVNNATFAKIFDVTTPQYFIRGIEYIKSKAGADSVFFVFSNDLPYCRKIFAGVDASFIFVEAEDKLRGANEMALMSKCRHFIISNSGFGWWPAFLSNSPDKIVICPDHWFAHTAPRNYFIGCDTAMVLDGWIPLAAE